MRNFFVFANFLMLLAILPVCSAVAGPLLENFQQRLPDDVVISHDPAIPVANGERLGRLMLDANDGLRFQMENAVIENLAGGIFLRGEDVVLTTADGQARSSSMSMVVPLLAWFLSDQAKPMPIHGAFEVGDLSIEMNMTPMGGGERLLARRLALGRAEGGEVMALLVDGASVQAPSGETMTIGSLSANFPAAAVSGMAFETLTRVGVEITDVSASRGDGRGIVALDEAAFRFRSAQPILVAPGYKSMLGRLGALYGALSGANIAVQAEFSGLILPKADLLPGELGRVLSAQPGAAFTGSGSLQMTVAAGQMEFALDQRLAGAADFSLRLGAALASLDNQRLAAIEEGAAPELTDFPQIGLQRISLRYHNQGVEEIVAGLGLGSLQSIIDDAAKPYLERAGEAAGSARQLLGVIGSWIEGGKSAPVCALSQMDEGKSVALTELMVIALISPDVAGQQLGLTDQACSDD